MLKRVLEDLLDPSLLLRRISDVSCSLRGDRKRALDVHNSVKVILTLCSKDSVPVLSTSKFALLPFGQKVVARQLMLQKLGFLCFSFDNLVDRQV